MIRLRNQSKYRAQKTTVDGITFDSQREAQHYSFLKLQQRMGLVKEIKLQPVYVLLEPYKHPQTGKKVQGIKYRADFLVTYPDGSQEVIDVKSEPTRKKEAYVLKKKLFESRYGQAIKEIL
ncbi:DUF1064 domain-containing protein [Cohnella xylanilytica]|jgi:Protein of unknown function (DUF1064).|uniref:DUF1064 domain-containing protein n=1 Tax=Cohnella xylanilytica TaxID=557555 RepID=A0A841U1I7_9BACL|nr:DUF1064 domain-containing protein [Cohnella xylanilytica]MBB6694395.1 DUF1064 domain-containing protein [Cohnella xylanilytica]